MPELASEVDRLNVVIEIGGMPVRVKALEPRFIALLERRYLGFLGISEHAAMEFNIELMQPGFGYVDAPVQVSQQNGHWSLSRGDFRAEWDPAKRRGWIRQTANPYSMDAVLRIVHTLVLANQGGFLAHSASAIRNGRAFLFAGVSGAGKTTISRLAPSDATLLSDEISYVRPQGDAYIAFGTPFTGELEQPGENVSAPVAALYLLAKGRENRIDPIPMAEAARSLLANILFFAKDRELVQTMFQTAFEFISRVPVFRLTFFPDAKVWELIR